MKESDKISKLGEKLVLALCLSLDNDTLLNILFAKVTRIIGKDGNIKLTSLVSELGGRIIL